LSFICHNGPAWPVPSATSHIEGTSPGTNAGAMTIQDPSPMIASASGISMAARTAGNAAFCGSISDLLGRLLCDMDEG
jgi:hypothetical protein